jgi:signal transduction histidine kinase
VRAVACYAQQVSEFEPTSSVAQAYARLLSLAVHEFRTPASVVGGYLRMLQRDSDAPLSERQRKMIDEAEKSCTRLVGMITELSDISKLDGGAAPLKKERFDLFPMLQEVADSVQEAKEREVHLQVRGDGAGATMTGDVNRLRAAFFAYFRAVVREQPASSVVVAERRIGKEGSSVSAIIVIAQELDVQPAYDARQPVFDEHNVGGIGLGLPLARRVVERHGGRIWSAPPTGTARVRAVIVSLPLSEHNR